jgi:hypothetical protein
MDSLPIDKIGTRFSWCRAFCAIKNLDSRAYTRLIVRELMGIRRMAVLVLISWIWFLFLESGSYFLRTDQYYFL